MALFQSKQMANPDPAAELEFLLHERVSVQWLGFLQAFSAEMQSQLTSEEYRDFLRSMGKRFGDLTPVGTHDTIEELESALNAQWAALRWGHVKLTESGTQLNIEHHFNPLTQALGGDVQVAGGFLEGAYEQWFRFAGADENLRVKQSPEASTAAVTVLQFGIHA